jgi:hypothetical protein
MRYLSYLRIGLSLGLAAMTTGAMADGMQADIPGLIEIKGTFVEGGVECPLFLTEDGTRYALQNIDLAIVRIGAAAVLMGAETQFSICQQGPAFDVQTAKVVAE